MQSLPGLFRNTARALQSSQSDHACMMAYSLGELIDNLRKVKEGEATLEEFFACYVFDSERRNLAESVNPKHYDCMKDEPADVDEDAHYSAS